MDHAKTVLKAIGIECHVLWSGDGKIYLAAQRNEADVVTLFLSQGENPNTQGSNDQTPLNVACEKGHAEVIKALLNSTDKRYERLNEPQQDDLHKAVQSGSLESVNLLLQCGMKPKRETLDIANASDNPEMSQVIFKILFPSSENNPHAEPTTMRRRGV